MADPATLLTELSNHLLKVHADPSTQLDTDLLGKAELCTTTTEYRTELWKSTKPLFLQISSLLPDLEQDPSPLIHFLTKLVEPYRFDDIKNVNFEIGLDLNAQPFHGMILTLLAKATASSVDAQALATRPTVMAAVVRLWLCTEDIGVASQAEDLLFSLLQVSKNEPPAVSSDVPLHTYGTGPIWKRLFADRDIASLYYHFTSLKTLSSTAKPSLNKRAKSIAQSRLLSWLPRVASLDWNSLVSLHGVQAEQELGLAQGQGLLHYAALKMVDTEDEILIHMILLDFYRALLTTVRAKPHLTHYDSSMSLDFLKKEGIHKQIIDLHTADEPGGDYSLLNSRTGLYISDYAFNYPENFENSPEMPTIRNFVHRNIRKCEASTLKIIASMPRSSLILRRSSGALAWDDCVILDMPITQTNHNALKTLAVVFHGPAKEEINFPQVESLGSDIKRTQIESSLARLLTALFYSKKPTMFRDITTHMETVALTDNALAALDLILALITSSWSTEPIPDFVSTSDPTYERLNDFPKTGLDLILDPSLSGGVFPCLLKPATQFSNLVGGHGDAENAAFRVATAKFDVLKALGRRLEEAGGREDVLAMVRRRVGEGPWGSQGNVGSRIGTLEL